MAASGRMEAHVKRLWFGALAAALVLPVVASAQGATVTWTRFIDPTENAFAFDVPQGWAVTGGISRQTPIAAQPWLVAVSPDGGMQFFIGDPEARFFALPQAGHPEGSVYPQTSPYLPPAVSLGYRGGADFSALYGPGHLAAAGCAGAATTGRQALPQIATLYASRAAELTKGMKLKFAYTPPQQEAGLVTFTCQAGGKSYVAGVIADTTRPMQGGAWAATVMGYLATPDEAPLAQAILLHVIASQQFNPQWDQAMRDAAQEAMDESARQNAALEAMLMKQSQEESAMLLAQGNGFMAQATANHNAFMAQMQQQSASRNANFRQYQAQRSLNSWKFNAYVRNGRLYRNPKTGEYYEVDN
jgi:hypothetical protein